MLDLGWQWADDGKQCVLADTVAAGSDLIGRRGTRMVETDDDEIILIGTSGYREMLAVTSAPRSPSTNGAGATAERVAAIAVMACLLSPVGLAEHGNRGNFTSSRISLMQAASGSSSTLVMGAVTRPRL